MELQVLISKHAAEKLFSEVRRWVNLGLQHQGHAFESLMYPLASMIPRQEKIRSPLDTILLTDIQMMLIDEIAIPPDNIKAFSAANCHFEGDLAQANRDFNRSIDDIFLKRPRLELFSKLHTHPFVDGDFLSDGDIYHGINAAKAQAWRNQKGLASTILHIVYPNKTPRMSHSNWSLRHDGAYDKKNKTLWKIATWASTQHGIIRLEDAAIINNRHHALQASRRKTYWQTPQGAAFCDQEKAALRAAGYRVSRNLLPRGWRRYIIELKQGDILVALPPDFPFIAPKIYKIISAWKNEFEELALPYRFGERRYEDLYLLNLVKHYGEPR